MQPFESRRRAVLGAVFLSIVPLVAGCASAARAPQGDDQVVRVIAQFDSTPPEGDAARRDFLDHLAASADVDWIEFVQPVSGAGSVLNVSCNDIRGRVASDPCAAAIDRLKKTGDVKSVERDAVLQHQ